MQGAAMAVASLCGLGFKIIVVTNQGGVARGKYTEDDVKQTHDRLADMVADAATGARIDAFYYCPYHPQGKLPEYTKEHPTRKPQPGMLLDAAKDHGLDLSRSWMVGDQVRDVQAGAAAGCRTILLRTDADQLSVLPEGGSAGVEIEAAGVKPDFICKSLVEAVRIIASQRHAIDEARAAAAALGVAGPGKRFDAAAMARLQQPRPQTQTPGKTPDPSLPGNDPAEGGAAARKPVKPFRPLTLPPPPPENEAIAAQRAGSGALSVEVESADEPTPAPTPRERIAAVVAKARKPQPEATSAEDLASADFDDDEAQQDLPETADTARTLRLILQELRGQRGMTDQTSPATIVAMVLQVIVGVCVLGGLWMGSDNDALFWRWILIAIVVQGAVIAALLFGRRG
jgi:D-glycero-D-manno-heptose 1,7-bisphosphate phosphatase